MNNTIRHLLKETQWFFDLHVLLEDYRLDKVQQMMNTRLPKNERLSEEQIEKIIEADPTTHGDMTGKYVEWLIKQYMALDRNRRSRFFEDLYKYTEALKTYHELKTRNKIKEKDINKIKSLDRLQAIINTNELQSVIEGFPDTRELEAHGDVVVLLRDPQLHLYDVRTHRAEVALGSNTQWCTVPDKKTFNEYSKDGPIFILYTKEDEKIKRYQFHFESEQFMNEQDHDDEKWLNDPRIASVLKAYGRSIKGFSIAVFYEDEEMLSDPDIQLAAVNQDGESIRLIKNPSEEVQLIAVSENGYMIRYIENPSEEVQLIAVSENGHAIEFINNPSEKVQLAAVNQNGRAIRNIKNPSEKVQLAAVNRNGYLVQEIENPSEEVQLATVNQDGHAIVHIKNPSEEVQLAAVKNKATSIHYIKNPSEKVQLAAVNQDGYVIVHIKNPSEKVQLAAILAIQRIKDPVERDEQLYSYRVREKVEKVLGQLKRRKS